MKQLRVVWFHRARAVCWLVIGGLSFAAGWESSVVLVWIASVYANVVSDWGAGEAADDHQVLDAIDRLHERLDRLEHLFDGRETHHEQP